MLSRCFLFGVYEIFVSSLFLLPILLGKQHCVSSTYKQTTGFEEKDNDSRKREFYGGILECMN